MTMRRRLRSALAVRNPSPVGTGAAPATGGRADPAAPIPGPLILDLVAGLVQGGAPPRAALRSVGEALQAVEDPRGGDLLSAAARVAHPVTGAGAGEANRRVDSGRLTALLEEALWLAARSGLPPTTLIRRSAVEERRRQISAQLRAIRRLEVLLVVPAGLCLLPAFILLGVVPVVLDLVLG